MFLLPCCIAASFDLMKFCSSIQIQAVLKKYDILLIADEVIYVSRKMEKSGYG
jgi:hypothetical protein